MAVYTEVSTQEARALLRQLKLGELTTLQGCARGIENTNYFVSTEQGGETFDYVLTLFERLTFAQLPFYLRLMKHLAEHGIPAPEPCADARGDLVFELKGKPAAVVTRLRGSSELIPTPAHCAAVGTLLAKMHLAGRDFELSQPHLRGLAWWNDTAAVLLPHLSQTQAALLQSELAYQNHTAASSSYAALPRGPIHADLFRDNVLFDSAPGQPELTGVFDFYFAGVDSWLFDLAVCLNDWCIDQGTGAHDAQRFQSLLRAYSAVRPLESAERALLSAMLRAAALRFWISRLWDYHLPRPASLLQAHDPAHFEHVLRERVMHPHVARLLEMPS
ncbi:MAG: homoserine kinase [Gammaproteobacteria bacterium]|uniref:homoserine kinase n=1 Tax=Rhodoferax sp. TaxID=50421 RepID=UPI0017BBD937|nr:homoserine kinase [Rhodoferax sp.]MBU3898153.1 homoserine kinase [Gammaproteobacteria bacterium]MBA3058566.1 homoserine kinase [Rhodoferax sp.]MBU3999498.1 homoserine kinase [Gammaproteobacteria bacterium]MBU4081653.1 homoserine kinase [Gammaproteobacteria bacterium]MBU4115242.1 homoserine kinase [Gammaproteobacteria bacterium]